jgi:serine phosphatase RsbU (regulator of sigma subunit)
MKNNFLETREQISRVSTASWMPELELASSRYHITAAWVAVIFNPIFALTDFFNIPQHWENLLIIRLTVSIITIVTLAVRKKYHLPSYIIVLVPFLLISLQNAYTFGIITNDVLLGHSLNYMALLIGGAMFILWSLPYSVLVIVLSALATVMFLSLNSAIGINEFFVKGGLLLIAVAVFMVILIQARYSLTVKEIKARLALKAANEELEVQKAIVESRNEKITDSIHYAKRIQDSILGHQSRIDQWFAGAMVFFRPKDILSGDFFWFYENTEENIKIVIAADCTGHGVPASMMTVLGNSTLNEIVIQRKIYEPDRILHELDLRIMETFTNDLKSGHTINDGMDVSILSFHGDEIWFSAAKNPLCIIQGSGLEVIPGSRFPIGSTQYKQKKIFEKQKIVVSKGARLFLYTDGFQDQFGGEKNLKYLSRRLREFLATTSVLAIDDQKIALEKEFDLWKGESRQTDDVLVVGIQI